MQEEKNEQPRELNRWVANLITALAGVFGGALGVLTGLSWSSVIPAILGLNQLTASLYFLAPIFALVLGPAGAMLGGWAASRYIAKLEKRPVAPKFRDNRSGGVITLVIKVLTWLVFLTIIGVQLLAIMRR